MIKVRHYRRHAVYPIILSALLLANPGAVQGYHLWDASLNFVGVVVAFSGQALRLWAWATNPTASNLRINGPYGFIRHPLYMGTFLIALGLLMIFNAPLAYLIVLPFLTLLYWRVAKEEEAEIERRFGGAYVDYLGKVPRFLPLHGRALQGDQATPFDWKRALGKEQESICGLAAGAVGLEFYEEALTEGFEKALNDVQYYLISSLLLGLLSLGLSLRKRKAKRRGEVRVG